MASPRNAAKSTFARDSGAGLRGVAVHVPLVSSKLRAPRSVTGYRERPRLNTLLDRGLEDSARLMLLSAPPGYGKTVALVGWLESRGVAHAWLSLDAADNDPARFARYLVAALRAVRPDAGDAMDGLLGPGATPSSDLVGATLLEQLGASDDPFALVLDDYQLISTEPNQHLVRFLIERGPPFAHLILLTRQDPPLPLARLRAHGRLVELRADDLRYTRDEASAYLAEAGVSLEPDLLERLLDRTEGWIAGLQLAAISLRDRPNPAAMVGAFGSSQRFVFDYLADEVFGGIDQDFRSFLVNISIADHFTAELCQELTGREDSAALLERAERANLFLVALDEEQRWYRYHGLFADYLRSQLGDRERRELHERAADYLAGAGLDSEAIAHLLAAGSVDRAFDLVERAAQPTFEAGELATLLGWLDGLPRERVAANAELVSLQGWALFLTGQIAAAQACAEGRAIEGDAGGPAEGRLYALRALLAPIIAGESDDDGLVRAGIALLGDDEPVRVLTLLALGTAKLAAGESASAVETLRPALAAARHTAQPMAVVTAAAMLALGLNATGARPEAEALSRAVLEEVRDARGRAPAGSWYLGHWVLGILRYETGDLIEARNELERGFEAAARFGAARQSLGVLVSYLALARQATGSPELALEAVRAVARDARTAGLTRVESQTAEIEARIRLMQGDLAAAAFWADQPMPGVGGLPAANTSRLSRDLMIVRVRLAQSRAGEAQRLLGSARAALKSGGNVAELISAYILEAVVAEATGRRPAARRALEEAIRLAAPGGYIRRFVDDGTSVAHLLPFVRKTSPTFVDQVIAAIASVNDPRGTASTRVGSSVWQDERGQLIEALTARELDVLRLMAQGATNAKIADRLSVSLGTAKWHVGNIRAKLGVTNRTQALVRAQELGLV
jgi:LuxR family transcriptional regulator, maltose regulon positive regulatory protein